MVASITRRDVLKGAALAAGAAGLAAVPPVIMASEAADAGFGESGGLPGVGPRPAGRDTEA